MSLSVAYVGNFQPDHSTENHVRQALEFLGHNVVRYQEGSLEEALLADLQSSRAYEPDLILWTRTRSLANQADPRTMPAVQNVARELGIPTAGYHLDRWWGLSRQSDVTSGDPFFRCDVLCTADGGHDLQWAEEGINHRWYPPAVSEVEMRPGEWQAEYASDLAFVGSWTGYGHAEWWPQRQRMLEHVRSWYGDRFRCWPPPGQPALRGEELRHLYASVKVVIGDSCLAPAYDGQPIRRYWSDRIPETVGRAGLLVHPWVEGLDEQGLDLVLTYELGDMDQLHDRIEFALSCVGDARSAAETDYGPAARAEISAAHTYTHRMRQLTEELNL